MRRHKKYPGFTLIELMVVASIIVILMMIGGIYYDSVRKTSRDSQRKVDLKTLSVALEVYFSRNNQYPQEDANPADCDSSRGLLASCNASGNDWTIGATGSDLRDLIATSTTNILNKLPTDPLNDANYFYIFELDKTGDGSPPCTGTTNQTCRYVLQARLEKENCVYSLTGGYGLPKDIDLKAASPDCVIDGITPASWGSTCCAQ